jgi:hypothetical protein
LARCAVDKLVERCGRGRLRFVVEQSLAPLDQFKRLSVRLE